MRLKDKVAVITGGARGIGAAFAVGFAREGAKIAIGDIRDGRETVDAVEKAGGQGRYLKTDVTRQAECDALAMAAADRFGKIDILVNNAGVAVNTLTLGAKDADFRRAVDVNLGGTFNCTRAALRSLMRAAGGGRIVNMTSVLGEGGSAGQAPYVAAKAGIIGLTKSWAREYASRGLTVNAVSPGVIDTEMTMAEMPATRREEVLKTIPLGRIGTPEDVASLVAFLAGPGASYITGQVLRGNGGLRM